MVDVQETPAVPPFDPQGDVRLGYFLAGGVLLAVGWGLGVIANVVVHLTAPSGGYHFDHLFVGPTFGPYAWAVAGLGAFSGAFGLVLVALGREAPRGPIVLPGYDY
jgi:hypothetical protein